MAESIESLSSCVFVQEVEAPALAVLIPVLVREHFISGRTRRWFAAPQKFFSRGWCSSGFLMLSLL